ncbi:MAG: VWA domain-containing protein [Anaerolineae bacterium]|nr:VWA domain-containing protein [Anaerolineae bacterium]
MRPLTKRSERNESGQSLILVALSTLALLSILALAIDFGLAYTERRRMQNAADAAALAGAWVLADGGIDDDVYDAVYEYAINQNRALSFEAYYLPGNEVVGGGPVPANATGIKVIARTTFPTIFAGVVGFNTISAAGTAGGGFSPLDIMLVFDRSGSMDDDSCSIPCGASESSCIACGGVWTLPPQPITDAKDAAKAFVDMNNPNLTHMGLASYADNATLNQQLTSNFPAVKSALDVLTANGCTNAPGGIATGKNELISPRGRANALRIIVFLTDGLPNKVPNEGIDCCSSPTGTCAAAQSSTRNQADIAAQNNIVIYAIGLGDNADMGLMQDIADITNGEAFYAPTAGDLLAIYQTIFDRIRLRLIQ